MMQNLPQIPERDAPPEVAAIYDEMRRAMRLPLVNLIYRHMATLPGVLPWVWDILRSLMVCGSVEVVAHRAISRLTLPELPPVGCSELSQAGVGTGAEREIHRVLDAYNRGNTLNLIALTTLRLAIDANAIPQRPAPDSAGRIPDEEVPPIPPICRVEDLDAATTAHIQRIVTLQRSEGVIPSFYLHLANWPDFLALVCDRIAPVLEAGRVAPLGTQLAGYAEEESRALLPCVEASVPRPAATEVAALRSAIDPFTRRLIPQMAVIGLTVDRAMPPLAHVHA